MNEIKYKILIIDDEKDIVDLLKYNLMKNGFDVVCAFDGEEGINKLNEKPDLILLDVMMPKMNGYEVCTIVKNNVEKDIPVIFLTAKTSEIDETYGLNIGASDFITKPISINKIIARINSNLRRIPGNPIPANEIKTGPLIMNREKFTAFIDDNEIQLIRKEFDLLFFLASNPGKVFNREKILSNLWIGNDNVLVTERTIDVHITHLRQKLGGHSNLIETIKGVGYKFKNIS
jgi:two-component system, OmpR family, alkaline phosphatase synthesis response regulator PhoP